jgi:hemoglobin
MRIATILLSLTLACLAGCGGKGKPAGGAGRAAVPDKSLYERLGGWRALTAVVEELVTMTGNDPRISVFFSNADIPKLKATMVEHICSITGGPCSYSGKSMKESHTDMKVKEEHFTAFMDDLGKTLDKLGVPAREKGEVLAAFESMKIDVVEH